MKLDILDDSVKDITVTPPPVITAAFVWALLTATNVIVLQDTQLVLLSYNI